MNKIKAMVDDFSSKTQDIEWVCDFTFITGIMQKMIENTRL